MSRLCVCATELWNENKDETQMNSGKTHKLRSNELLRAGITEISTSSSKSFDDAIQMEIKCTYEVLKNVVFGNGKISGYRVRWL
jgi:hypothetical protein